MEKGFGEGGAGVGNNLLIALSIRVTPRIDKNYPQEKIYLTKFGQFASPLGNFNIFI